MLYYFICMYACMYVYTFYYEPNTNTYTAIKRILSSRMLIHAIVESYGVAIRKHCEETHKYAQTHLQL